MSDCVMGGTGAYGLTLEGNFHDGALDGQLVAGLHVVDPLGHLAGVILFDEEGELAGLVGRGDGGVRADDGLARVGLEGGGGVVWGLDDDAGGDGEEGRFAVGELKDELGGVVVVGLDALQGEVDEGVGVKRALFLLLGGLRGRSGLGLGVEVDVCGEARDACVWAGSATKRAAERVSYAPAPPR